MTASIASARIDGLGPPAGGVLALAEQQRVAEVDLARRRRRAPRCSTTEAAELRQLALGHVGVLAEHVVGHDEAEHGVAEELEALVRHAVSACSAHQERCASARSMIAWSRNRTPSAPSRSRSGPVGPTTAAYRSQRHPPSRPAAPEPGHDVVDGVAHGAQVAEVLVVDAEADGPLAQLVLERLDELDQRERVGAEVVGEAARRA